MIRLRHLATIANSNVDKITDPEEIPVRLCNYVDVYKNDRITDDMAFMAASATRTEINKFGLKVGDVIITKDSEDRSDIAVPAYVSETAPDLVCGYHLALLRGRPQLISSAFLFWALQSKRAREAFSNAAGGVTRFGLTLDGMKSVVLPCPDRETQEAITDFLDCEIARINQLIEKKGRLIELIKERERACITYKFSQLDAYTWQIRHLGKLKNGAGFPIGLQGDPHQDIAFFKVKHLKTHGLDTAITDTDDTVSKETARSLCATVFPKGTIVFAKIGAALLLRRFSMLGRVACIDNNMSAFIPNEKLIEPNFALLGLSQADMMTMVQPGAVPSLNTEAFYSFRIPLPSREVQRNFVDEFRLWRSTIIQIIEKTQRSIECLCEFRSALITAAVTGRIDVATWSKRGQTDRRLDEIEEGCGHDL